MIHKISLGAYILGICLAVVSVIRWFIIYNDYSNAVFGVAIGLLTCILGYVYNYLRNTDDRFANMQRQLDTIGAYVTHNMDEANKEEMLGEGNK